MDGKGEGGRQARTSRYNINRSRADTDSTGSRVNDITIASYGDRRSPDRPRGDHFVRHTTV